MKHPENNNFCQKNDQKNKQNLHPGELWKCKVIMMEHTIKERERERERERDLTYSHPPINSCTWGSPRSLWVDRVFQITSSASHPVSSLSDVLLSSSLHYRSLAGLILSTDQSEQRGHCFQSPHKTGVFSCKKEKKKNTVSACTSTYSLVLAALWSDSSLSLSLVIFHKLTDHELN